MPVNPALASLQPAVRPATPPPTITTSTAFFGAFHPGVSGSRTRCPRSASSPPTRAPTCFGNERGVQAAAPAPVAKIAPAAPAQREDRKAGKTARAKLTETTRPLRIELQRIDDRLAKLHGEKTSTEAALAVSRIKPETIAELGRNLSHIAAETSMLEERWLELQGELEAMQTSA